MPIKKDLSNLPTSSNSEGLPPRMPRVVTKLAEAWFRTWTERENFGWGRVIPEAGPYRGSLAAKRCDRQLQYALLQELNPPPKPGGWSSPEAYDEAWQQWMDDYADSDPDDEADIYRMMIGQLVHDVFQQEMAVLGDGEAEVPIDLRPLGIPGSMRVDWVQHMFEERGPNEQSGSPTQQIPVELKTINGYGFKACATTFKGPPKGPRSGHMQQLALAIVALDAPYGVLGYLSLENIGPELIQSLYDDPSPVQKFAAEWAIPRSLADAIVENEAHRINYILDFKHGLVPRTLDDPEYPAGAIVRDPDRGTWVRLVNGKVAETGKTHMCGYCPQRERCKHDGEGYVAPEIEVI